MLSFITSINQDSKSGRYGVLNIVTPVHDLQAHIYQYSSLGEQIRINEDELKTRLQLLPVFSLCCTNFHRVRNSTLHMSCDTPHTEVRYSTQQHILVLAPSYWSSISGGLRGLGGGPGSAGISWSCISSSVLHTLIRQFLLPSITRTIPVLLRLVLHHHSGS